MHSVRIDWELNKCTDIEVAQIAQFALHKMILNKIDALSRFHEARNRSAVYYMTQNKHL